RENPTDRRLVRAHLGREFAAAGRIQRYRRFLVAGEVGGERTLAIVIGKCSRRTNAGQRGNECYGERWANDHWNPPDALIDGRVASFVGQSVAPPSNTG